LKRRKKWRNGRDTEASESEFHEEGGLERRLFVHLKKEERKKEERGKAQTDHGCEEG
jgi:hypothetical protein